MLFVEIPVIDAAKEAANSLHCFLHAEQLVETACKSHMKSTLYSMRLRVHMNVLRTESILDE